MSKYFFNKFYEKFPEVLNENECWIWQGLKDKDGYGVYAKKRAHRVCWEAYNAEPIPTGMVVMHSCDNPSCVNPFHLSIGSNLDNMRDKVLKNRQPRGSNASYSKLNDDEVLQLRMLSRLTDFNSKELGNIFGISDVAVRKIISGENWNHLPYQKNDKTYSGTKHHWSKLTEANVLCIHRDFKNGIGTLELAKKYNVSRPTINRILSGKIWKKVNPLSNLDFDD